MPKESLKIKIMIIAYVLLMAATLAVTYRCGSIRFLNGSLQRAQELSDGISETMAALFAARLADLERFAEEQIRYVYEDKTQLSRVIAYFEEAYDMRVLVVEQAPGGLISSDGDAYDGAEAAYGWFDTDGGFADSDLDGDGVRDYAVYCVDELSDGRKILTIGVYGPQNPETGGLPMTAETDSVYLVREDGAVGMTLWKAQNGPAFDNANELAGYKRIRAGAYVRTDERGNLMFGSGRERYAAAYSRLGIDWQDGAAYILVIHKTGSMLQEPEPFLYTAILEAAFFIILGIPFVITYCKYVKTDMQLADSRSESEAKTIFLSRFSHDFRTPINSMIGMVEIAGLSVDNPKEVSYCLNKISTSADYMLEMLSEILDIAKMESDKLELANQKFSLMEVVRSLNSLMYAQASGKNITFTIKKKISSDILLIGDSVRLKQVLVNLISNAIKFTEEGGRVQFHADETMRDDGKVHMRFRIMDDGVGMSQDFMERMYEPFESERYAVWHGNNEGAGLGLAICRSLVRLMGGSIHARSRVGEGTEFAVDIDFAYEVKDRNYHADTVNSPARYDFTGRRILLVDDNLTNLDIAARQLKWVNAEVDMATDGQKAVKRYLDSPIGYYDVILMDIQMPGKSGLEAATEIRRSGRADSRSIPIAAMTAKVFAEDRESAAEAGIHTYLTKPIKMQFLYASLDRIFAGTAGSFGDKIFPERDSAATAEYGSAGNTQPE